MGALIMSHSDDDGLILPPEIAPFQIVIIPIGRKPEERTQVMEKVNEIQDAFQISGIRVKVDDDETNSPGWKYAEWELKGVPLRLTLGPRDIANNKIEVARRDLKSKEVIEIPKDFTSWVRSLPDEIQHSIFQKALDFREQHTFQVDTWEEFKAQIENSRPGMIYAHWDGTSETEEKIKEETKATIRCIPLGNALEEGTCVYSNRPSRQRVLFARAY